MSDAASLSALLASRLCHDLISPVGALSTGLEVLDDESDEGMREHAFDLIRASAAQAGAKLEFLRLAFGAAGGLADSMTLDQARVLAEKYFKHTKQELDWRAPEQPASKSICKLVLNLCLIGIECIPRGGVVRVDCRDGALTLEAEGPRAKLIEKTALAIRNSAAQLDAKSVQPYLVALLVEELGGGLDIQEQEDLVQFRYAPL